MPRHLFGDFDHRAVMTRAQTGRTRRVGDARRVADGHTWPETFRDRITAQGLG